MITSMRRCVAHNDHSPWSISSRSFSHDFAIKVINYGTSCRVRSTPHIVLCRLQWPWTWAISSRSFNHVFAIKLLKYGISWCVHSTTSTMTFDLDLYLHGHLAVSTLQRVQFWMDSPIWHKSLTWEEVSRNDLWPWPISSKLFSCDTAYFMDYIHMWHKYNLWRDNVSHNHFWVNRLKSHSSISFFLYQT